MSSHGRSDITDPLFSEVTTTRIKEDQAMFVDSGYKIGKLGLASGQYGLAVKWLQRALEAVELSISNGEVESVKEKRFLILHALGRENFPYSLMGNRFYLLILCSSSLSQFRSRGCKGIFEQSAGLYG